MSLAGLRLIGDYMCGVSLACSACPWNGGQGVAYYGDAGEYVEGMPSFGTGDLDAFFAFAQQHAASHATPDDPELPGGTP